MERKGINVSKLTDASTCHVWILDATDDWVHICRDPLANHEIIMASNDDAWPKSKYSESNYATC
mgnify:CR=1 FL=1